MCAAGTCACRRTTPAPRPPTACRAAPPSPASPGTRAADRSWRRATPRPSGAARNGAAWPDAASRPAAPPARRARGGSSSEGPRVLAAAPAARSMHLLRRNRRLQRGLRLLRRAVQAGGRGSAGRRLAGDLHLLHAAIVGGLDGEGQPAPDHQRARGRYAAGGGGEKAAQRLVVAAWGELHAKVLL